MVKLLESEIVPYVVCFSSALAFLGFVVVSCEYFACLHRCVYVSVVFVDLHVQKTERTT